MESDPESEGKDLDLLGEPRLMVETGPAARVANLIAPALRDLGFRLVRVRISGANGATLQIMAERPDGTMSIGDCELASEVVSPLVEIENIFTHPFHFEMSSPGIDRPLVRRSDFVRAIGQEARLELSVPLNGRKRLRGFIQAVLGEGDQATVSLRRTDARADEEAEVLAPLCDVAEAKLLLTDALVRQALRADKAARSQAAQTEASPEAEAAPWRGPGRFAHRHAPKAIPVRPGRGQKSDPRRAPRSRD